MTQQNQATPQEQEQQQQKQSSHHEEYPHPTLGHGCEVRESSPTRGAVDMADVPAQFAVFFTGNRDGSFQG